MAQTARISSRSDSIIQEMVSLTGYSKVEVIEHALEVYRRNERMRLMNKAYQTLKSDKSAWKEEIKDREELEGTIADGFEEESSSSG
ncbi:hypothetical protein [Waddlia chondrophila]|uniref:Uncharacterized protein n=1 Tax=Waddlia chondrophila (strain ATCC VR-1470 / WSU 86-1044) TaxID=716544 RepID=D6YWQ4_WADCW|nr:hypothetical protein [Waddlia chondrophila]ADI38565.1 hypothetical protein wcw_1208 [Waddlia chondrophila WSU 86-1044]